VQAGDKTVGYRRRQVGNSARNTLQTTTHVILGSEHCFVLSRVYDDTEEQGDDGLGRFLVFYNASSRFTKSVSEAVIFRTWDSAEEHLEFLAHHLGPDAEHCGPWNIDYLISHISCNGNQPNVDPKKPKN
jgi:hypothetical protein